MKTVAWARDPGGIGRVFGMVEVAHEAAPGTVLDTPTEGLATTQTERTTS